MERFTRHEAVILTRTSPSRLAYLAKTGIVVPYRLQQAGRWRLFYSWDQILELRTIHHLRQQTSLQTIRKILRFLEDQGGDHRLCNQKLVITEDGVSWVRAICTRVKTPKWCKWWVVPSKVAVMWANCNC
jgi:DNA-binding transcriptional MerR regulator